MSKFTIEIDTSGDAFQGVEGWLQLEVAHMLSLAVDKVQRGMMNANLYDTNGNRVGRLVFED